MRFTIRDIMLVMVIVALAVGWWVDRSRLSSIISAENDFQALKGMIEREGYEVLIHEDELMLVRPVRLLSSQTAAPNSPQD